MNRIRVEGRMSVWQVALRLGRVSNLPTVWTNVAAGIALSGGAVSPVRLILLLLSMSLFYTAGMYLNDAFDRKLDARERPERPIPSGRVSARTVFVVGFGLLAAGEILLVVVSFGMASGHRWPPVASGLLLAGAIVFYDFYHKTNPLSPVVMGLCRVLVYTSVALAVAPGISGPLLGGAGAMLAYLVGLTYAAKQEKLAQLKSIWPLGFLAIPFIYGAVVVLRSPATAIIYAGFLLWVAYAVSHLLRRRVNFPLAVGTLIAGISFLDALLIAGQGHYIVALLAVGAVVLTRLGQRFIPGT